MMDFVSNFAETLSDLMFEENEISDKEFAKTLGVPACMIGHYRKARNMPNLKHLVMIADYFQVSTDFMLGREHEVAGLTFKQCPPFSERLLFLTKYFGCSQYAFYRSAKISGTSFIGWKKGSVSPTIDSVIKIADRFECRVDFVLGRES